jgi:phosphoserine phosphatase RsbU/P
MPNTPPSDESSSSESASEPGCSKDRTTAPNALTQAVEKDRRLFALMHQLSMAASSEKRIEGSLSRFIAHRSMEVTGALGAAVYLLDATGRLLTPECVTNESVLMIAITQAQHDEMQGNKSAGMAWAKLKVVEVKDSFLGSVLSWSDPGHIKGWEAVPGMELSARLEPVPMQVLVAPLICGTKRMGVMALTFPKDEVISEHDWMIFAPLVEQCAYALFNAELHKVVKRGDELALDVKNAAEMQRLLHPPQHPKLDGYEVFGTNVAARMLSGDFYDYLYPDGDHFGIVIADVSGKGFPAAMVAVTTRSSVAAHCLGKLSPSHTLRAVNRQVYKDIREDMFVTMSYVVAQRDNPEVTLCRAGHLVPLLWSAKTGTVRPVPSKGIAIGVDAGHVFDSKLEDVRIGLESGDCLLLYTDGVNEASCDDRDEFGEQRIIEIMKNSCPQGAKAVVDDLLAAVIAYMGDDKRMDDITIVAMKKT